MRYFQYIANNVSMGTFSPMVQALSRRLFPLFAKELEKFSDEEIEHTGVVALLTMAKLYRPNARQVVLDFEQGTMLEVSPSTTYTALTSDEDENIQQLLEAADNELLTPPTPDFAQVQVEDAEPLVGVQLPNGKVVQMKQSDYQRLLADAVE